jgi:hypothetical protein
MDQRDDRWADWEAGPVSRPFTVTGGRTQPRGAWRFDLIDTVLRTTRETTYHSPERARILELCQAPTTVAELAAAVGLPLGVVRVVLDDLLNEDLIEVTAAAPRGQVTDLRLLRQVLNGLERLLSRNPGNARQAAPGVPVRRSGRAAGSRLAPVLQGEQRAEAGDRDPPGPALQYRRALLPGQHRAAAEQDGPGDVGLRRGR